MKVPPLSRAQLAALSTDEREVRKLLLLVIAAAPCPQRRGGGWPHDDPDNSGQCIYCGALLDMIEGVDF